MRIAFALRLFLCLGTFIGVAAATASAETWGPESAALDALDGHLTREGADRLGGLPSSFPPGGHELARAFLAPLAGAAGVFGGRDPAEIARASEAADRSRAAEVLARRVTLLGGYGPQEVGTPIDWSTAPEEDLQWPTHLSRHYWLEPLARLWRLTGEPAYAEEVVDVLLDWVDAHPIGDPDLAWIYSVDWNERTELPGEGFFHGYVDGPWTSLSAHARVDTWSRLLALVWDAPAMTNEAAARLLLSLDRDHRLMMLDFPRAFVANQYLSIARSLVHLGWWYPFLAGSESAEAEGWRRIADFAERHVYPDGSMSEVSPNYSANNLSQLVGLVEQSRVRGRPYPEILDERIPRAGRYFAWIADPAGNSPRIAKGGKSLRPLVRQVAALYPDPFLEWFASAGRSGKPPEALGRLFPWVGHAILRSDWTPEATWIFFEPGPRGAGHHDLAALNFHLRSRGRPLLADPGFYTYSSAGEEGRMGLYLRSSAAHNVALVDGLGQLQAPPGEERQPNAVAGAYGWSDDGGAARASGEYGLGFATAPALVRWGYDPADPAFRYADGGSAPETPFPVVHRRTLDYDRGGQRLTVTDRFEGAGRRTIALHWQIPPEATVAKKGDGFIVTNGPAAASFAFEGPGVPEIRFARGSRRPLLGWFSAGYGDLAKATTVVVEVETELPAERSTVIEID